MLNLLKKISSAFAGTKKTQQKKTCPPNNYSAPSEEKAKQNIFDKVMNKIQASDYFKTTMQEAFWAYFNQAQGQREFEKIAREKLLNETWTWPLYNKWHARFKEEGKWPRTWSDFLTKEPHTMDEYSDVLYQDMSVNEIKSFLKEQSSMPKPMPKNKDGWILAIKSIDKKILTSLLEEKYRGYRQKYEKKRRLEKLSLLYAFLIKSVYGDRRKIEIQDWIEDGDRCRVFGPPVVFISDFDSDRNIECVKQLADQFNAGKLKEFPPYFPGCSFNILADRKRK
jgi:hypothetical protein